MPKLHLNLKKILVDKCDILQVVQTADAGGQLSGGIDTTTKLATDQPCRLIPIVLKGAHENTTTTRLNVTRYSVFLMPVDGIDINEHLWLQVWQFIGGQWVGGRYYNIVNAPPQLMEGAPIELMAEEIRA